MPVYEDPKESKLGDPSYFLQFVLAVGLCILCGTTVMLMWNWFVVPLGLPAIGLIHAIALDTLVTFIVTTRVNTDPGPFWDRWIATVTYALLTLLAGWLLHFFI